jgi:RHS repeat-associated protein
MRKQSAADELGHLQWDQQQSHGHGLRQQSLQHDTGLRRAGDLQSDGANTYLYDADGTRVAKGTITNWSAGCDTTQNGFTMTASYILGPGNEQLAELSWSGGVPTPVHTNVWAGGQLTATYSYDDPINYPAGILYFPLTDWLPGSPATGLRRWGGLGTRRMLADQYGNLAQTCDSLPFGDGESCPTIPTEHLFTGKERDTESGNDYFEARYYSSSMGRFMSPDWSAKEEPIPYAKLDDPQSLNLYAYVLNNPLDKVDADGHLPQWMENAVNKVLDKVLPPMITPFHQPTSPGIAILSTSISGNTTTLTIHNGKERTSTTVDSLTKADSKRSKPGAGGPYENLVKGVNTSPGIADNPKYGPKGAAIDTGDVRGQWAHGGGSSLPDPFAPNQKLTPTLGCTRLHNQDAINLGGQIEQFQKANPASAVISERHQ